MFPSSIYSSDRPVRSPALPRGFSPGMNNYRPSPRLAESLISPIKQSTDLSSSSDFNTQLLLQIRRLDPSFVFQASSDSPQLQTLSYLTQAVDSIILNQGKLPLHSLSEHDISQYLKEDLERSKETSKNLKKYENLLKKKEEKLEEEKQKLRTEKITLKELEEQLKQAALAFENEEKNWEENKKYETEKIRLDKEEVERKLFEVKELKERMDKKIDETTKHLKFEKDSLMQLENCLNQTKTTLAADQKRISQEKLEIEKEKWKLEQRHRKVEENEILLNVKQDHLEQEKLNLENEKINLQNFRKNIEDEKSELFSIREQIITYDKDPKAAQNYHFEDKQFNDYDSKLIELDEREKEIEQAYKELQEQMDNFNRELEEREIVLDERELLIEKQEKDMKKKMDNFQIIENSLIESKNQVDDLRTFTIPELEKQSNYLENLLQELNSKKEDIELLIENLNYEISIVTKRKNVLSVIEEDHSIDVSEQSPIDENDISELAKDLESKIFKVKEREEELEFGLSQLERDKSEVVRAAEIVKKSHEDIEEKRRKFEREIIEEKEKLKSQILKIETGSKLLSAKEAEILAYKKKLDERSQVIQLKEKELRLRKTDPESSIIEE